MALQDKIQERIDSVKKRVGKSDLEQFRSDEVTDQLEARKERAKIEARKEEQKQQRQKQLEAAREEAREEARADSQSTLERLQSAADSLAIDTSSGFDEFDEGPFESTEPAGFASGPFGGESGDADGLFSGGPAEPVDEGGLRAEVDDVKVGLRQNDAEIDQLEETVAELQDSQTQESADGGFGSSDPFDNEGNAFDGGGFL